MSPEPLRLGRIRPRPLHPGDLVYLFAPASPVKEPYRSRGIEILKERSLKVQTGASFFAEAEPLAAGSRELRLHDLEEALSLPARAILPARGGYGAFHLLPDFPAERLAEKRILWVGSSDITYLNVSLLERGGLVHFYGPMPCGRMAKGDEKSREAFQNLLFGELPYSYPLPESGAVVQEGEARGELRGGCLSILASLCGTPFRPALRDSLLLLEDRGEPPYRIERYLLQLYHSGALDGVQGILFSFADLREGEEERLLPILQGFVTRYLKVPALYGLPFGHLSGALPLPLGVRAELTPRGLTLLEEPFGSV